MPRTAIPAATRCLVFSKTLGLCWYCGERMELRKGKAEANVEHQQAVSNGGADDIGNLVPACFLCNSLKGTKTVEEFRAWVADDGLLPILETLDWLDRKFWFRLGEPELAVIHSLHRLVMLLKAQRHRFYGECVSDRQADCYVI